MFELRMLPFFQVWDLKSSKCVAALKGHASAVTSVGFSEDKQFMIRSASHTYTCTPYLLLNVHPSCATHMMSTLAKAVRGTTCFHVSLVCGTSGSCQC